MLLSTSYIQSLSDLQPKETTKDLNSCGEKTTKNKNEAQGEVEPVTMRSARPAAAAAPAPNAGGAVLTRPMRGRALEMSFLEEEKRVAEEVVVVVSTVISTATSTCGNQWRTLTGKLQSRNSHEVNMIECVLTGHLSAV